MRWLETIVRCFNPGAINSLKGTASDLILVKLCGAHLYNRQQRIICRRFFWLPLYIMKSKSTVRQKCLENRNIAFNKKGNDCLKKKDINLIISEIKYYINNSTLN